MISHDKTRYHMTKTDITWQNKMIPRDKIRYHMTKIDII